MDHLLFVAIALFISVLMSHMKSLLHSFPLSIFISFLGSIVAWLTPGTPAEFHKMICMIVTPTLPILLFLNLLSFRPLSFRRGTPRQSALVSGLGGLLSGAMLFWPLKQLTDWPNSFVLCLSGILVSTGLPHTPALSDLLIGEAETGWLGCVLAISLLSRSVEEDPVGSCMQICIGGAAVGVGGGMGGLVGIFSSKDEGSKLASLVLAGGASYLISQNFVGSDDGILALGISGLVIRWGAGENNFVNFRKLLEISDFFGETLFWFLAGVSWGAGFSGNPHFPLLFILPAVCSLAICSRLISGLALWPLLNISGRKQGLREILFWTFGSVRGKLGWAFAVWGIGETHAVPLLALVTGTSICSHFICWSVTCIFAEGREWESVKRAIIKINNISQIIDRESPDEPFMRFLEIAIEAEQQKLERRVRLAGIVGEKDKFKEMVKKSILFLFFEKFHVPAIRGTRVLSDCISGGSRTCSRDKTAGLSDWWENLVQGALPKSKDKFALLLLIFIESSEKSKYHVNHILSSVGKLGEFAALVQKEWNVIRSEIDQMNQIAKTQLDAVDRLAVKNARLHLTESFSYEKIDFIANQLILDDY